MVTCQAGRPSSDGGQKLTTKPTAAPSPLWTDGLLAFGSGSPSRERG